MPQFNIPGWLNAKLVSSNSRPEHHGAELVPAIDLKFSADVSNDFLDQIDPLLRQCFYTSHDKTEPIPGETKTTPNLLFKDLIDMPIKLKKTYEGYRLTIDRGLGEERGSNIVIGDCKVNEIKPDMKDGGTVNVTWRVQASGVDSGTIGDCGVLQGHEIKLKLEAPSLEQEKNNPPFKQPKAGKGSKAAPPVDPAPDAGTIFAAQHGQPAAAT